MSRQSALKLINDQLEYSIYRDTANLYEAAMMGADDGVIEQHAQAIQFLCEVIQELLKDEDDEL